MNSNPKVFLLHNEISPYRLPLFEKLAEEVDLTVYFCYSKSDYRRWETPLQEYGFRSIIGDNYKLGPFRVNSDLWNILRRNDFDVYIVGGVGAQTLFAVLVTLLFAKLQKKPFIFWSGAVLTTFSTNNKKGKVYLKKRLSRFLAKLSDSVITYGEMAKEYLLSLGVNNGKLFKGTQVMPSKLLPPPKVLKNFQTYDKVDEGNKVVLTISYFQRRKGLDILIQSFKEIDDDSFRLIIAGTGEEECRLKKLAEGDFRIIFPGYVDGEQKASYYELADVFVLPTLHDPWGLVINEAMHYGLPVITTEAAGAKEIIKGNGFVVQPGDSDELTEVLERLLKDEKLRIKMKEKSKKIIHKYDTEYAVSNFIRAIDSTLGDSIDSKSLNK